MALRVLLDTHVVIRGLVEREKLSRAQRRVLDQASARHEQLGVSDLTLLEMALLLRRPALSRDKRRIHIPVEELLMEFERQPIFQILPVTPAIASEIATLAATLRDPLDAAIVATARVHGLTLLTSDQRIIDSGLVPVVE